MVLYHCVSAYQIIHAMVHKKLNHAKEYSVLIIADFTANKFADYLELVDFFNEIILFPYREIEHNVESIIDEIGKMYEERVTYRIEEFSEIYVAAAHYYFSLYLIAKKVSFHFIEDGCGILSKPKVSYDIVMNYAPIQANIAQTYGMFDGNNKYVIDRICNLSAQSFQMLDDNIVDFDLVKEMKKCDFDYIDSIMKFFRVEKLDKDLSEHVIVFTQQLANLGILTFEEQVLIYQLVTDFFVPEKKIAFKTHPDDVMYYKHLFPQCCLLEGRYPAELLPFVSERMADCSMTIFSSSVLSIRSAFKSNIFCGYDFDKTFKKIDSYYFALSILGGLEIENYQFYGFGVDIKLIENLLKFSLNNTKEIEFTYPKKFINSKEGSSVYLFDDLNFKSDVFKNLEQDTEFIYKEIKVYNSSELLENERKEKVYDNRIDEETCLKIDNRDIVNSLEELPENDIVIFLNTEKDYCFYEYDYRKIFKEMLPIRINKKKIREYDVYLDDNSLILYFYSKNEKIKEKIKKYKGNKKMENTGMIESVDVMTDEQRKIAILEGMLEATEKRLAYYIEKEKKQKEEGNF